MTEELDEQVKTAAVSVGTSAVALPTTALANRQGFMLQNLGPSDLYIGASTVTTATGVKVPSGSTFSEPALGPHVTIYGIVASSTADVRVMETA
jgi:hypothetical protein